MALTYYEALPLGSHERAIVFAGIAAYAGELAITREGEFDINVGVHDTVLSQPDTSVTVIPPDADPERSRTTVSVWGYGAEASYITSNAIASQALRSPTVHGADDDPWALTTARNLMHATTTPSEGHQGPARLLVDANDESSAETPETIAVRSPGLIPVVAQLITTVGRGTVDMLRRGELPRSWVLAHLRTDTNTIGSQPTQTGRRNRLYFEQTTLEGTTTQFDMVFAPAYELDGEQVCYVSASATTTREATDRTYAATVRDQLQYKEGKLVVARSRTLENGRRPRGPRPKAPASHNTVLGMAEAAVGRRPFPDRVAEWGV
jgi:hypothetical protein